MTETFVHPTAVVDPGARLGAGTKVWHFAHVMDGAVIGRDCVLGQNAFVASGVIVGDGCKIQNNVSLYEGIELEDFVFCGPSMVFTNVRSPRAAFPTDSADYASTLVRRGATIGANATIVCGMTVGAWAFVGAGAVVTRHVPDFALVVGVPGRVAGWVCECGNKLDFDDGHATCSSCSKSYEQVGEEEIKQL